MFRCRPIQSTQILPSGMLKIFGRIVAHAILLEGIGFPYLAPCLYWYIATQSESIAAQYTSVDDLGEMAKDVVQRVSKRYNH